MVENCENCAFGQDKWRTFSRVCRRHAPIATVGDFGLRTVWPAVQHDDFCGDFELKDAS